MKLTPELIGAGSKFQRPEGVVTRSFCGISGLAPSAACSAAGLVKSDLFNSKAMLPTDPDDSITSSSYVSVKGTRYLALPSTPAEFVSSGGTASTKYSSTGCSDLGKAMLRNCSLLIPLTHPAWYRGQCSMRMMLHQQPSKLL